MLNTISFAHGTVSNSARKAKTPGDAVQTIVEKTYYRGMAKYERLKDDTTYAPWPTCYVFTRPIPLLTN